MNINLSQESIQVGNNFQGIHHYLILKIQLKINLIFFKTKYDNYHKAF